VTRSAARKPLVGRRDVIHQAFTGAALLVLLAGCGGQAATATLPPPTATAIVQPPADATTLAPTATPETGIEGTPGATGGQVGAEATRPTHATPASSAVPIGFKLYTGRLPFTVAYPATWLVDESHSETGQVYFYAPGAIGPLDNATWVAIGTAGPPTTDNLDESRDQFYNDQFHAHPEAALDVLRHAQYAGLDFATAGIIFTAANENCYATIGVALKGQMLWQFRLNARYTDFDLATTRYFTPMLRSLTIASAP
jgi:hypothetical protein